MVNNGTKHRNRRCGGVAVEFAIVVPVFFVFVFGLIEFSRMVMCYQVMTSAAREGARRGAVPGATTVDLRQRCNEKLQAGTVSSATVTVAPPEIAMLNEGELFTVTVQGAYDGMGWLPMPQWLGGRILQTSVTMAREGN